MDTVADDGSRRTQCLDATALSFPLSGKYLPVMRSAAPALLPIFRAQHQATLLAWLLMHPSEEYTISDLAQRLHVPLSTMQREADRLVEAGLLRDRSVGRARLLRANTDNRAYSALTQLLELTFGPQSVIAEEFGLLGGGRILIYGSWAERFDGTAGASPYDIDVLVVGDVRRADLYDAADRAQARLAMQVNPVMRTAEQWRDDAGPLVVQLKASPTVDVTPEGPGDRG